MEHLSDSVLYIAIIMFVDIVALLRLSKSMRIVCVSHALK